MLCAFDQSNIHTHSAKFALQTLPTAVLAGYCAHASLDERCVQMDDRHYQRALQDIRQSQGRVYGYIQPRHT